MAFTRDQIQRDITAQLGGAFIPIEIKQDGWDAVFNRTLEVYSRYKPLMRHESYQTPASGMMIHNMPDDVLGISTVEMTPGIQTGLTSGLAIESQMLSGVPVYYGVGDTYIDIQYLDLRRRWIKTVSRELGSDPDWAQVIDPETMHVSLWTFSTGQTFVDAFCIIPHADDLSTIQSYSHKWVADWAKTEAMITIGNARDKWETIPVAGGKMVMNGARMLARAEKEQLDLINQIQSMRADLFPRWA
jgi:hypothetical protein